MRKSFVVIGLVALALAAVPVVVLAGSGQTSSQLDRQLATWTTSKVSTSSTEWRNVRGLRLTACTIRGVSATLSVTVEGAPVAFRVVIDTPEGPMRPGAARFVPQGRESFSYTFARRTLPFEDDDTHGFTVQWRSPTGERVTMARGLLNLLFQAGINNCP
jgi:hypothetical protein